MTNGFSKVTRRDALGGLALLGTGALLGVPPIAASGAAAASERDGADLEARAHDWDWLVGNWIVAHSRLNGRLRGSNDWQVFHGESALWRTMGGLGNVDDNLLEVPSGTYRAISIRAYDPKSQKWAIWWLDGRKPGTIFPPVWGNFEKESGTFYGHDTQDGRPVLVRFLWRDLQTRPLWEQAFSTDNGKTWEINWRNIFKRTASEPTPLAAAPGEPTGPGDWRFLEGLWNVRHRRLRERLVGSTDWDSFGGTLHNRHVMNHHGNVSDNIMEFPQGRVRGVGIRAYDPDTGEWLSWWLDGRDPVEIAAPVRGSFENGTGTFVGDDVHNGRPVLAQVTWSNITRKSARWEQAFSVDGGATWEVNWVSEFPRAA